MLQVVYRATALLMFGWLAGTTPAQGADSAEVRLVPFPKELQKQDGTFDLKGPLVVRISGAQAWVLHEILAEEFARAGLPQPELKSLPIKENVLRISAASAATEKPPALRPQPAPEEYTLAVTPNGVTAASADEAGLFYAVQTLAQLVRANRHGTSLPCLTVRDWPSIRWRAFQDDLTRGPSSTLEELRRAAWIGASLKQNLFTYYMEYQYAFQKHPLLGPPDGSLRPEELRALVEHARPLHLDILGNQQSFGHFGHILKHDAYKPLAENAEVLSPVNENTYKLLDDMYSEVIPLLPFGFFNVCCDETWGLGDGPSKKLAEEIGVGGVYIRHIQRVHQLVRGKYGKRMMMWGDIILNHPKDLEKVPKDVIMLTWGYDPRENFENQIIPFAKSGYEFFVCPGVNNWSRILPDFAATTTNVRNFVRDGVKHGALGVLNTAWDDDGETLNAPNWHGIAWGAECAWNASATSPEDFNRRIGAVLFGEKGDHFGQAIALLSKAHALPGMGGMMNGRFWQLDLGSGAVASKGLRSTAGQLRDITGPAIGHLEACRKEATLNAELLDAVIFGARRMELIADRILGHYEASSLYQQALAQKPADAATSLTGVQGRIRRLRDRHAALEAEFKRLWAGENRPYALDWTLKRYAAALKTYDDVLARLEGAQNGLSAGKPLPPVEEVGLCPLQVGVRRTRPDRTLQAPLDPDAAWAVPAATHRLGLSVKTGPGERQDWPLEVDVTLPPELAARPARAFVHVGAETREAPAQIVAGEAPGRCRLVAVLNGRVPADSTLTVTAYLGLTEAPALPRRASTQKVEQGVWLENDAVRALLGTEGAHLYRWEVKALDGRDLTMPGEQSWFGFSDLGGAGRGARNTLKCLASGPALVRYLCEEEAGLSKMISLYAGVSWVEVMLDLPVAYYWDFDDPKNFAGDGPTPGRFLFSTGAAGPVGRQADGLSAQVRAAAHWAVKYASLPDGRTFALGMASPEVAAHFVIAPGEGAGGVGVEGGPPVSHFVTFAGLPDGPPGEVMDRLRHTLDLKSQPEVTLHALQPRAGG